MTAIGLLQNLVCGATAIGRGHTGVTLHSGAMCHTAISSLNTRSQEKENNYSHGTIVALLQDTAQSV